MLTLALIGLVGGLITGISPCILPVLPVIFFAGTGRAAPPPPEPAEGGGVAVATKHRVKRNRRPYAVIGGLMLSFSFFTLLGSLLLSVLGLPGNVLRVAGLVLLVVIGLGLMFPPLERLLEKPFSKLPKRQVNPNGGAFVLGLGLGLLYVPCAGPVLAAITVAGASNRISLSTVVLTLAFAVGATLPLLVFALAGKRVSERVRAFQTRAGLVRKIGGAVMVLLAIALAFNLTDLVQRALPDYTSGLQQQVENNPAVVNQLSGLTNAGNSELSKCTDGAEQLQSCGAAPELKNITQWLNSPGLTIAGLRGKVVLIDFWTYSCINCQRSLPQIEAWDKAYKTAGLQVIGVHTPEFAFEQDPSNVASQAAKLGVTYPVALDNGYGTWDAYRNRFWPAEFLIDSTGTVRHLKLGEGGYDHTEAMIRQLLQAANPTVALPASTQVTDKTVTDDRTTRETYLNYGKQDNYSGDKMKLNAATDFQLPSLIPDNSYALGGRWTPDYEKLTAGDNAHLTLNYQAKAAYLVLGGSGSVQVSVDGKPSRTINVSGPPESYQLVSDGEIGKHRLDVTVSAGLSAYDITFG